MRQAVALLARAVAVLTRFCGSGKNVADAGADNDNDNENAHVDEGGRIGSGMRGVSD